MTATKVVVIGAADAAVVVVRIKITITGADVCKTLCTEHLLAPKYIAKFAAPQFHKNVWTLLKSLTGNLFIIPYHLTKFQTPSSNLADKIEMPFAKGHNLRTIGHVLFKS